MAAAQEVGAIPDWLGTGTDAKSDWNTVLLGDVILPGICEVTGLDVGVDVETKKAKGSDQTTSTDNGTAAAKFEIRVWLNSSHWPEWLRILPNINPRRPGRERSPLAIIHPDPNSLGIRNVRVLKIKSEPPTARGGKRYVIECIEWFDKPKATKKKPADQPIIPKGGYNTIVVAGEQGVKRRNTQQALREMSGKDIDPATGKSVDPANEQEVLAGLFQ